MADSTYLKHVVEPFVVKWVSERIQVPLTPRQIAVGPRMDGVPVHFAFDGVSEDGEVGLLVSTSHSVKSGAVRKLHADASILLNAPFSQRIMAFISEEAKNNFVNRCDGLLPLGNLEMLVCDTLPMEMKAAVDQFQRDAKSEVGDLGKAQKAGGQRR